LVGEGFSRLADVVFSPQSTQLSLTNVSRFANSRDCESLRKETGRNGLFKAILEVENAIVGARRVQIRIFAGIYGTLNPEIDMRRFEKRLEHHIQFTSGRCSLLKLLAS
jgi:hypothetical protein